MTLKIVHYFIALLLLPLIVGFYWGLGLVVIALGKTAVLAHVPFWLGLGSYFLFQAIFMKPVKTYIFGHELTHALAGIISGARLKSFKVSKNGGSVVLTKSNLFITLAPYFIPIYTLIIILLYYALLYIWKLGNLYPYFLFLCGFTLSFHFSLTQYALAQGQSDMKVFGNTFSMGVILLLSVLILSLFLKLFFPENVCFRGFLKFSLSKALDIYVYSYFKVKEIWLLSIQTK